MKNMTSVLILSDALWIMNRFTEAHEHIGYVSPAYAWLK